MDLSGIKVDNNIIVFFVGLAALLVADAAILEKYPPSRSRVNLFILTNISLWILANVGILFGIRPISVAATIIIVLNILILIFICGVLVIVFLFQEQQRNIIPYIPHFQSPQLRFGLNHLEENIIPMYLDKIHVTLSDKRDAMSDVLWLISVTTMPATIENLVRMTIFEVQDNGGFRILAAHHIDAQRIPNLERTFRYASEPKGMVGHTVVEKRTLSAPDLKDKSNPITAWWVETPENSNPGQNTAGILCVPVFNETPMRETSKCLAVISISCSQKNYLTLKHQSDIEAYATKVKTLLVSLNKRIAVDTEVFNRIRVITLSGEVAAGKTALAREFENLLVSKGWKRVSMGQHFKNYCLENRIASQVFEEELDKIPSEIHKRFDDWQKQLLTQGEKIIVDGRLSGYFAQGLQDVFKIFCDLPEADRIQRFAQRDEISLYEAEIRLKKRDKFDLNNFRTLYQLEDYRDPSFYDFVIETNEVTSKLIEKAISYISKNW